MERAILRVPSIYPLPLRSRTPWGRGFSLQSFISLLSLVFIGPRGLRRCCLGGTLMFRVSPSGLAPTASVAAPKSREAPPY